MSWDIDSFKINWTEHSRGQVITSVTGYSYQIKSWKMDYFEEFDSKIYKTTVITTVDNQDGTVTMTVSRNYNPMKDGVKRV